MDLVNFLINALDTKNSEILHTITNKIDTLSNKLKDIYSNSKKLLIKSKIEANSFTLKISELQAQNNYLKSSVSDQLNHYLSIIEFQEQVILYLKSSVSSKNIDDILKVSVKCSQTNSQQKLNEELLVSNTLLKSEILRLEGNMSEIRILNQQIEELTRKNELLEKVNVELSNKKNEDSDDSLDLDFNKVKNELEIQELKAALRSISERYDQEKENILKDCEESRQDIETQMFRLKNEKAYIEVKYRDCEKQIYDMNREKERLEIIISNMKRENENLRNDYSRKGSLRRNSSELCLSLSNDFELTESLDKIAIANNNELFVAFQEEINDLALILKESNLLKNKDLSGKECLKKTVEEMIKIYKVVYDETGHKKFVEDLAGHLSDIFKELKEKIHALSNEVEEKEFKMQELVENDRIEIRTEPSPRVYSPRNSDNPGLLKKQLLQEKTRVYEKKHKIRLHKEQIWHLKQNVRELQDEMNKMIGFDIGYLKEMWWSLGKEIPSLDNNSENKMDVFAKIIGFTQKELISLNNERKQKKSKFKFGIF